MIPFKIMLTIEEIRRWLEEKSGVLVTKSALVHRESYFGHSVIAPNSSKHDADERGFVPVELWIMSVVEADNPIRLEGEGLTSIKIGDKEITLKELLNVGEKIILGDYADSWPLAKILDIGGHSVETSFGTTEIPPIPVHVHPQKTEAYFFPPTNIPPYHKNISAITRIGLKPGISKKEITETLHEFGYSDRMYTHLVEHKIEPMTGWTVLEGVLHAPGPYLTFEIQKPQDDYHLSSWRLGERLEGKERDSKFQSEVLRGLIDATDHVEQTLNWTLTTDPKLKEKYFHTPQVIESGSWGKRHQIFFDMFYGEGWEILPGQTLNLEPKKEPQAGIVWSGQAEINGNKVEQSGLNEFLVVPQTALNVANTGKTNIFIYTVEPIRSV